MMGHVEGSRDHFVRRSARTHESPGGQEIRRLLAVGPHVSHPLPGRRPRRTRAPKSTPEDQHPIHTTTCPETHPRAASLARHRRARRRSGHDRLAPRARRPHPARDLDHPTHHHHLGVGHDHARKPVLILTDETSVTITDHTTSEILGNYLIEPEKNYWRNQTKEPGRWPGSY